ncbi:MAG: presqualene diphosphate synthase HpnD [Burkholderiales bacterium]|nr:presqualene diphosphate synthase HpnD [Burkholderiales bacterium]MCE7876729.1 squalene synthase HpnD [Betaproteobacteria bacterium PRO3]
MTPDEYCASKAARSGSSFYYSFRLLPEDRRRAITALYAYCREVDDVVDEVHDPVVARAKLAWWRLEVASIFGGTPAHPVAQALVPVVRKHGLVRDQLEAVIDGMTMDLDQVRYADFADLERYCHRVAGVVGLMSAEIFGYEDAATRGFARDLGIAFQLTNIVRDVGEDARRGRIYLPTDELARFGVSASAIQAARMEPGFVELMRFQIARARSWYDRAMGQLAARDRKSQRPSLAMAAIYRTLLDEIERDGCRVLDRRIALTPLRKLWIAWRVARTG